MILFEDQFVFVFIKKGDFDSIGGRRKISKADFLKEIRHGLIGVDSLLKGMNLLLFFKERIIEITIFYEA